MGCRFWKVSISIYHIPLTDCPYKTDIYFYNLRRLRRVTRGRAGEGDGGEQDETNAEAGEGETGNGNVGATGRGVRSAAFRGTEFGAGSGCGERGGGYFRGRRVDA